MRGLGGEHRGGKWFMGTLLISLGTLFLLQNFGVWHFRDYHQWWPIVFFVIAAGHLASPTPRRIGSAVSFIVIGLWFFGCANEWHGMSYVNSWPLLLVGFGLDMLITATLIGIMRRAQRDRDGGSDHA